MKKLCLVVAGVLLGAMAFAGNPKNIYVAQKTVAVKEKAKASSKTVHTAVYADFFEVKGKKGSWYVVMYDSKNKGYIPAASVTERKLVAGKNAASASAKELALAGKAWSKDMEVQYSKSEDVSYDKVDSVEENVVSDSELKKFISAGKLKDVRK